MPAIRKSEKRSSQALPELLKRINECTEPTEDGGVRYLTFDLDELFFILPDAFNITPALSREKARTIFRRALIQLRKGGEVQESALLAEANRLAVAHLSKPKQRFTLSTKFRANQMAFSNGFSLRVKGVRLESRNTLPKYHKTEEFFLSGFGQVDPSKPTFFGHLIGHTEARDSDEATTAIFEAMHLFMGLFNLHRLRGQWRFFVGKPRPDGDLWLGPFHLLYKNRRFVDDRVWYNPDYSGESWRNSVLSMDKVLKLLPQVRKVLALLSTHPLNRPLERAIWLIQEGMATRESGFRLLRYWAALENLYTEEGDRKDNERTIRRATFAEQESELAQWTLRHIANLRNDYVHYRESEGNLDTLCQHVRDILTRHILWLIHRGSMFENHRRFLAMTDLPHDSQKFSELKEDIARRELVVRRAT